MWSVPTQKPTNPVACAIRIAIERPATSIASLTEIGRPYGDIASDIFKLTRPTPHIPRPSMKPIAAFVFLVLSCASALAMDTDANRLFSILKGLEGEWRIVNPARDTVVTFEIIAAGSALVEKWTMSPSRNSMTIYSMDGDALLVTHFCPQGNAPTLKLTRTSEEGVHFFEFVQGWNLQDKESSHQHAFWIKIVSPNEFTRGETYIKNGSEYKGEQELDHPQTFIRVSGDE